MVCNCFNTTCCADPEYKYDHKSDGHDDTLDKVRGRCCQESSQCGVSNDDQCTDDHSWQIFYTEETCKKFTTGCKSGSCIRNKKDHDKNRSDRLQDLFLISVTITEKEAGEKQAIGAVLRTPCGGAPRSRMRTGALRVRWLLRPDCWAEACFPCGWSG